MFENVTPVFAQLSDSPNNFSDEQFVVVERFTVQLYDKTCHDEKVNESRRYLFTKKKSIT